VKLKEGERVLDFWSSFCEQMLDWDIKLGSALAREYFESAIAEKHEVRNTYAGIKRRHPEWSLEAQVVWLIKMIDHFEEEQVVRDWNRLIQGKNEPVMKFFGRYEKALATSKLYEGLTYEQELKSLLDKLRMKTQMAFRIYMRIKPFKKIEDIIDSVKTFGEAAGIKDEPAVHVARKGKRYKDRSRKPGKGILRARKVTKFASSKKWKFWGQVGVCWSCGKMGHKVAGCPDLGKAKSDEKPKVKEAPAVNTASVEPLPARKLPVIDWEIDNREEGDQSETISCLLDTGSEIITD